MRTAPTPMPRRRFSFPVRPGFSALAAFLVATSLQAANPPVAPAPVGVSPPLADVRLEAPKDLNGFFPFHVPDTREAWERRAEELRRRILVSTGLWPMPAKTPLNAVIHGKVEREGFTVEKVYFEAVPGFYVTGMLFRPTGRTGPFPGVLCPHGHGGRLQDVGVEGIRKQIVLGEERFESSGRFPKLTLCAQLARMGCVSFIYDMIGYADCSQIPYELAHRFAKPRAEMAGAEGWGFFSAQAEMRLQSIMGLQTWMSVRALDFLASLPDVDASRLGVTGGSGGGTQTILLGAIDPRPVVAFPQGMVSTAMQGGCTCENTSLLRIGTGNVELAGLFAPRAQAMTTANDWTKDMMTHGFPELQRLYRMLGAPDHVQCTPMPQFPHNFNYVARARMYSWFNQHLRLGLKEPIVEGDFELLGENPGTNRTSAPPSLSVWNAQHPAPKERGPDYERRLLARLSAESDERIRALWPADAGSLGRYRDVVGGGVETLVGRTLAAVGPIRSTALGRTERETYRVFTDRIAVTAHGEQVPVVSIRPPGPAWNGRVVIWLTARGQAGLFAADGTPVPEVRRLVERGHAVVAADLFAQGEFLRAGLPGDRNRVVPNPREFAGYTYTYNHALFAQRTHDVLSVIAWLRTEERGLKQTIIVGVDGMGPVAAAAGAVSGSAVDAVAVDIDGFRFTQVADYRDANFLTGIVKYGDVPALLALNAPKRLLVLGDDAAQAPVARGAYAASGGKVTWQPRAENAARAIGDWLLSDL
jgi:dienelactone hydrolase